MPIVARAQWGAHPATGGTHWRSGQPSGHTWHWEGAGGHADHAQCAAEVRAIQAFHFSQNYSDIAYNWIICTHGVIFEGRPVGYFESAAQRDGNHYRIAVCFMWGPRFTFSQAAKDAGAWLGRSVDPLASRNHHIGHRDEPSCATGCPGDEAEAWVHAGLPSKATPTPAPAPAPAPAPLPTTGVRHPTLRRGSVGPAVMELQRKLNVVANTGLSTDGQFGPRTETAVRNFQAFFRLGVDGIAGPQTWGMLDYCAALRGVH